VADVANITADGCNSNGIIDPNETVTVSLGIKNTGTLNTTNLVGTLQATGGVTSPSSPQTYGVVVAGGATVFKSFTFTAGNFACGAQVVTTLQLQDGATNLGTISYNFATGVMTSSLYATGDIAVAIPDNNPTGVDIPLTIADVMTLSDVNVRFRLNHTFDRDLIISLVHPDNTVVTLVSRRGSSGVNFGTGTNDCAGTPTVIDDQAATAIAAGTAPFAGSFKPDSPLSVLNGKASNGTWKLRVSDVADRDTGTVGCFKLELNKRSVCCGALIVAAPPAVVTAENGFPVNGVPDPGETVRVNLSLANIGLNNTTNLVGTLQATGGVTNPSGPQTYGVVVAGGSSVAQPFTFTANGNCGDTITLTLALQDGPNNLGNVTYTLRLGTITSTTQTFTNSSPIIIPASGTGATTGSPANPYPSNITVSGAPTTIAKLTMTINAFNHTFPDDVDLLLVSPTGRKMIVMSDCGNETIATNLTITLDDDAASVLPDDDGIASGTFKPSNYDTVQDPFPATAPVGPYLTPQTGGTATLTSAFTGVAGGNPNGTWSLYVVDDASVDTGNINGGWQLALTSSTNVCGGLITAASIKSHGGTPHPIPMPLVGTPGIECRSNSATNDHQLAVTFPVAVSVTGTPQAQVTSGSGTVGTGGVANGGAVSVAGNVVTVPLTNVPNAQTINVTLFGVSDGASASNVVVPMSVLFGDVNGDGFVLSGDYTATRQKSGTPVDGNTFQFDVNVDGFILSGDYTAVRQQSGTQLP
jgi:subtilisin-like proprotein convertase family protein